MNIVFITSDQQRGDCYGFEGRKVKTPHLDAMARAGTRFSACITPNLVCQPSRASILTGLLPYTHGVSDNGIDLDPEGTDNAMEFYPDVLRYNPEDESLTSPTGEDPCSIDGFLGEP